MLTRIAWLSLLILLASACSKKTGEENQDQGDANPDTEATPTPTPTDQRDTGNGDTEATEVARRSLSSIALGFFHTCALTEAGNIKCWGMSRYLGNGNDNDNKLVPVDVLAAEDSAAALLDDIVQVSAGRWHSCALTSGGNIKCWGDANKGQLGNGSTANSSTANSSWPVYVIEEDGSSNTLDNIVQIAAGVFHTCALTTEGGVKCWGAAIYGALGSNTSANTNTPVVVMGADSQPLTGVVQITAGNRFNCAVTTSGGVKCWGAGEQGQLGNGSLEAKNIPVDVVDADNKPLTGIVQITAGHDHACALTNTANVMCWGGGGYGQLGNAKGTGIANDNTKSAHTINVITAAGGAPLADIVQVAAGQYYSCALTNAANVKCWGRGHMLGNGENSATQNVPVDVQGLSGIVHLAGGEGHICAVNNIGYVKCWGRGRHGQLGNGDDKGRSVPSDVIIEQGRSDLLKIATQRAEQVCYDDGTCKIE